MAVLLLLFFLLLSFFASIENSAAQTTIPAKYDGFVYPGTPDKSGSITVEAFFDPLCPDSRDSWPPLKQALQYYSPHVSLIVHPFPLPYHSNAYIASRALHIADKLNTSTAYPLLELFFKYQEDYYNDPTLNKSRASIIDDMVNLAVSVIGSSSLPAFRSGFKDPETDKSQIISFKYGCSRGVADAPTFFVNGFVLPGAGAALDYEEWRSIVDPLVGNE